MGAEAQRCCGMISEGNDTKNENEEKKRLLHQKKGKKQQVNSVNEEICNELEKLIQRDPGKRGIKNLHIPGQLYKACSSLISTKNVVIMTGYVITLLYTSYLSKFLSILKYIE